MLADFYIPRLSKDMKIAVQKNHLRSQILYKSRCPKKWTISHNFRKKREKVKLKLLVK